MVAGATLTRTITRSPYSEAVGIVAVMRAVSSGLVFTLRLPGLNTSADACCMCRQRKLYEKWNTNTIWLVPLIAVLCVFAQFLLSLFISWIIDNSREKKSKKEQKDIQ